jgi:hypothetical protein
VKDEKLQPDKFLELREKLSTALHDAKFYHEV